MQQNTTITRENYESFLLDRIEGRLDAHQMQLLDDFLAANTDLETADEYYDETFAAHFDGNLHFEDKNSLIKKTEILPVMLKYVSVAAFVLLILGIGLFIKNNTDNNISDRQLSENINDLTTLRIEKNQLTSPQVSSVANKEALNAHKNTSKSEKTVTEHADDFTETAFYSAETAEYSVETPLYSDRTTEEEIQMPVRITDLIVYENSSSETDSQTQSDEIIVYENPPRKSWRNRAEQNLNSKFAEYLSTKN